MNTRDNIGYQKLFLSALETSPNLTEKDREGALKAWITRHANEGYAAAEEAKRFRAAGEEGLAQNADRGVARAARKLNEKLKVLQDHVGHAVPLHNVVGRRIAAAFEGKINVPAPKPRDPHVIGQGNIIDTAQRAGLRPAPDPKADLLARMGIKKPGVDPSAEWHDRNAPPKSEKPEVKPEPPPPKKEPPKEFKHEGKWKDIREEYAKHREKAREQGFERVDVQAPQQGGEGMKHRGYEFLEHWDGRKIEYHLEHDKVNDNGKLKIIEHASENQGYQPGGVQKNPQKDVMGNAAAMIAANRNPKEAIVENKLIGSRTKGQVGETHMVKFKDGSKAIYKPEKGTGLARYKPGMGLRDEAIKINRNIGEKYRDLAAYKISEAAGFNIVPHVELVDYKIGTPGGGHAMAFIDGVVAAKANWGDDAAMAGNADIHRIAALDFIIGNTDRHAGNFMRGKSGRYYAIDNGLAFPDDMNPQTYRSAPHYAVKGQNIPKEVQNELKSLNPEHIAKAMKESGFSDGDVKSVQARAKLLAGMTKWEKPDAMWRKAATLAGQKLPHEPGGGW